MIRSKMKRCKFLISKRVDPGLDSIITDVRAINSVMLTRCIILQGVFINSFETLGVVLECWKWKHCKISLLSQWHDIDFIAFFLQKELELFKLVVVNALKDELRNRTHGFADRARKNWDFAFAAASGTIHDVGFPRLDITFEVNRLGHGLHISLKRLSAFIILDPSSRMHSRWISRLIYFLEAHASSVSICSQHNFLVFRVGAERWVSHVLL